MGRDGLVPPCSATLVLVDVPKPSENHEAGLGELAGTGFITASMSGESIPGVRCKALSEEWMKGWVRKHAWWVAPVVMVLILAALIALSALIL